MSAKNWLASHSTQLKRLIELCDESLVVASPDSHGTIKLIRAELEALLSGQKTEFDPSISRARIDLNWDLPFFKPLGKFLDEFDRATGRHY